ncbi:hypothetical protein QL216_12905, partial [Cronobacter turicensis]|uniref:hypothetical protein n=1 Tax=Cronobacter turicensis TaxID=413502 RepID=UPI0024A7BB8D
TNAPRRARQNKPSGGSTTFLSKVAGRYGLMSTIYGLWKAIMALCAPTEKLASTRFRQKGYQ